MLVWKEDLSAPEWDSLLITLSGHFLQSALWSKAKAATSHMPDHRWAAFDTSGRLLLLVRFETRLLGFIKIAWIPMGPVGHENAFKQLKKALFLKLRQAGFHFCIYSSPQAIPHAKNKNNPMTIQLDLTRGKDLLWQSLNKQLRYDIRRGKKLKVLINQSVQLDDLIICYQQYQVLCKTKKFKPALSFTVLSKLLELNNKENTSSQVLFFVAHLEEGICGSVIVIRFGTTVHYLWGTRDFAYNHLNVGRLLQWHVIEWAIENNCTLYNMEGIDKKKNYGVFVFKKEFGGEEVGFSKRKIRPLLRFGVNNNI